LDNLEEAVDRVANGDTSAFRRIVETTSTHLVRLSARMLGSVSEAEDVVQEAYVKAYRAIVDGSFDRRAKVRTWLYRIVTNSAIDAMRKRAKAPVPSEHAGDEMAESARSGFISAESWLALAELGEWLSELPEEQRAAIVLKSVEGFSSAEIAEILQCSEGAVEQKLVRARATLRRKRSTS
jgi:RNA polymerase sigma-70 factor (ECF subfamily)